jgi:hypothetical protein
LPVSGASFSLSFPVQNSLPIQSSNHTLLLGKTSAKFTKVTSAVVSVLTLSVVASTGNQRDTNQQGVSQHLNYKFNYTKPNIQQ